MASNRPRWTDLLLLSRPPSSDSITYEALKSKYKPAITALLRRLGSEISHSGAGVILDVALPVPLLVPNQSTSRRLLYPYIQDLVAGLYKLFCVVAATENVNVEDRDGIDVRIILLQECNEAKIGPSKQPDIPVGTVTTFATLARCQRPWTRIFSIDDESDHRIYSEFRELYGFTEKMFKLPRGSYDQEWNPADQLEDSKPQTHFDVILGGTFDHIHIGHKLLLTMFAFLLPAESESANAVKSLTIGITGDELLKEKKYAELLESWDERTDSTVRFLRGIMDFRPPDEAIVREQEFSDPGPNGHALHTWLGEHHVIKCAEISDPYGPTITVENLTALVVSGETRGGGKAVNDRRREKGWAELEAFEVDVLDPKDEEAGSKGVESDFQAKLSSTTIRKALSERLKARSKV